MERPIDTPMKMFSKANNPSYSTSSSVSKSAPQFPKGVDCQRQLPLDIAEDSAMGGVMGIIGNNLTYLIVGLLAVCFGICVFLYREIKNLKTELQEAIEPLKKVTGLEKGVQTLENTIAQMVRMRPPPQMMRPSPQMMRPVPTGEQIKQKPPTPPKPPKPSQETEEECEGGVCEIPPPKKKKVIDLSD